jgi:hypothetical protein
MCELRAHRERERGRLYLLDVAEEVIAEPSTLRGATDQPGDVCDLQVGRVRVHGLPDADQVVVPSVLEGAPGVIWVDCAEREV